MLFFWNFYLSKNPGKNVSQYSQKYQAAQLFSLIIIIRNMMLLIALWLVRRHVAQLNKRSPGEHKRLLNKKKNIKQILLNQNFWMVVYFGLQLAQNILCILFHIFYFKNIKNNMV